MGRLWGDQPDPDINKIFDQHADPDPTGVKALTTGHRIMFEAYLEQGFTEEQALQLTCALITALAVTPPDPNA